jgi:hypothetical protein
MDKEKHLASLAQLKDTQMRIRDIHPIFDISYPVAIVKEGKFFIYDIPLGCTEYRFIKSEPCPYSLPAGVRAAFPMECYGDKMAAVVTEDVFDSLQGYITILHEFVHCAQGMSCEMQLKDQLEISKEYKRKKDYMWEINHPFPYEGKAFTDLYAKYMDALSQSDIQRIKFIRGQLARLLSKQDAEYLLWQEWKEGFPRFLENKICKRFQMMENHRGNEEPFSRTSFYESGSRYIQVIEGYSPIIAADMERLFEEMQGSMFGDIEE